MNITICDDRIDDRKNLSDLLSDYGEKKNYEFAITEYDSGEQLCEEQSALEACQILFLDINMQGMDGLKTAMRIKEKYPKLPVVLVTAYMNYALDGYKVKASRFLLKDNLADTIPEVHNYHDLGDYYLNQSGMVQMPEEWKGGIDLSTFGRNAAAQEKGAFTEYGYIVESGDEWERQFEGREVPEEYRIMSYPQPERGEQDKAYMDAAETQQADAQAAEPQQPRPVVPIILTSEKPAEKVKEITARLEQGVQAIFDSDRYKEFLTAMSKFHDYSLNNTILIAMQGGNLVMGFRQWEKEFDRHVKKGEKGIKIFAPAPYKVKKLVDKIDPETRKPMLDREGKVVKEEKEITVPAFKVITVFDISQTEGKEFPDLSVKPLLADVEQYEDFFAALEKASPVPIAFEQITNGANGYFSLTDKRIASKEGVSELQAVKTAIHEIAHAKLHDVDLNAPPEQQNRVDRHTCEVEAESVAYTVCQHFGLDTSDYSFGYVAGWSSGKEMTELKASLETIQTTSKELITEIEGHFTELQQQRQAEQEQGDTFSIYQLKRGDETRDLRFEPYDRLQAAGLTIDRVNYELVYTAPLTKDGEWHTGLCHSRRAAAAG